MDRRPGANTAIPSYIAALALTAGLVAACGLSVDDLFTSGSGGSGGAGGAPVTTTTSHSSSHASTSGSTTASSSSSSSTASSSSSSTTSSSSGGPICGDGVCSPGESQTFCPQDCGPTSSASSSSSSSSGGGTCSHDTCDTGGALATTCSACTASVCSADPYCCSMAWDNQCVDEANTMCGSCCGNGVCNMGEDCTSCAADCGPCGTPPMCPHSVCAAGAALDPQKCHDPCVNAVCAQKPACCGNASWDASCQALAGQLCGADPCVSAVCATMPACCTAGWTQACVLKAEAACPSLCNCAHTPCEQGGALDAMCDPCAKAMCTADSYCCDTSWDGICTSEAGTVCGLVCP